MTRLADLRHAFEGIIPSSISTVDSDGLPNVSYLSQVHYVDEEHVALTNQFFSKTAANIAATRRACVMLVDGVSGDQHVLDLVYSHSVESGDIFNQMSAHLQAVSAQHAAGIVMRLRSADIYRVESLRAVPRPQQWAVPDVEETNLPAAPDLLPGTADICRQIAAGSDPDALLDTVLAGLEQHFGIAHSMLLLADEGQNHLTTLTSRGYGAEGVGAETALGDGIVGIAAKERRPIRIADLSRSRRYIEAMRASTPAEQAPDVRHIPVPGLAEPLSQVAVPLCHQGRLRGVLLAEATRRFAFHHEHEGALCLIAGQLATTLRLLELEAMAAEVAPRGASPAAEAGGTPLRVRYYRFDDSLFIDDAYIIKGVPGRLLYYFLKHHQENGRQDFTNREVRIDPALRLPDLKDNLETRLILLRRRLEEKQTPIRLLRPGRGEIRLELTATPVLEVVERT
ncbi:GAF domain-containing protein [Radicibacter daui]|uniref:GAF domain-containing protein n=1 Tax=Radicibacter daui TaxID=3064829 RepID=UPI0040470573